MAAPSKKSQKRNSKDGGTKFSKSSKKAFKPSKERNNAVQSKAVALQLEDDVPDFPRGGVSSLSKREREEIHAEVDSEFGAEANKSKKNKRIEMQKKTAASGDDLGSLFGHGITGKLPRFANKITLKVDVESCRIALGMKSSYLSEGGEIHSSEQESDKGTEDNGSFEDRCIESLIDTDRISPEIQIMGINGNEECTVLAQAESRSSIRPLEVILDDSEHSDVHIVASQNQGLIDTVDTVDGKGKRQAKKKSKEEREQKIRAAEERLLGKNIPTTADDYEKLVRSSPNSSLVWMKYMAFVLSLADVEKARSIAERALRTINVREENEKLNIWVAYFNLENEYGNPPEEAVTKVFHRALQCCDPKKIHLALLGMYERTGQNKFADELLDKMIEKFKHSCKVWLRRVQSLLTQQQDRVQSVVQRTLLSLPRHKHIKFISQTAILEFKCGVPERGRSMLEGILREYPKRTDLWSIYLDQEIRLGDVDVIRALFERAISLSLPPKKMKFLFKKYLEYEKSNGDEKRVEYVKQKAMDYVHSTLT